jgi:hypothetical protein
MACLLATDTLFGVACSTMPVQYPVCVFVALGPFQSLLRCADYSVALQFTLGCVARVFIQHRSSAVVVLDSHLMPPRRARCIS